MIIDKIYMINLKRKKHIADNSLQKLISLTDVDEDNLFSNIKMSDEEYYNEDQEFADEAEYQESKQISFKLLYGGITKDYMAIEFFAQVKKYTDLLFEKFSEEGYIESPLAGRKLRKKFFTDINPSKLLNYFIQIYETERNIHIISSINELLQANECKLILYTYDSFLFDMSVYDENLIRQIKDVIEHNNKFPAKLTKGDNYHNVE